MGEGAKVGIEQGNRRADRDCDVVVASIRSLHEGRIGQAMAGRDIGLVIYDECRHAPAEGNTKVLEQLGCFEPDWPGTLVGFTAIADRRTSTDSSSRPVRRSRSARLTVPGANVGSMAADVR